LLNDLSRSDDDLCVRTVYATPTGTNERVLSAPATRTMMSSCDPATAVTLATQSWEYDTSPTGVKLPAGKVSAGRTTSQIVSPRNADTGAPILDASGSSNIRTFDATYNTTSGALASVKTTREDGATRTMTTTYDSFALAPVTVKTDATNADGTKLPSLQTILTRDPLTLDVLSTTDPNGTRSGNTYDGFGRVLLSTVTPAGGTTGALSSMSYVGFGGRESGGRRVVQKVFTDPVALANVGTAAGRTSTIFLDALGRITRTEAALGTDYANQTLILGQRVYDKLGRVQFEADPHPSTESMGTAYGTSRFFNTDGTPSCVVRGNGPQAFTAVTDEVNERYPTCVTRFFGNNREFVDTRNAASLLAGSAQAGVVHESTYSAIGQLLERATYKSDASTGDLIKIEGAQFGYDRLGDLIRMARYQDPQSETTVAVTTWHFDTLGQMLELDEPGSAPQFRSYDNWGELTLTQWNDTTHHSVERSAYDQPIRRARPLGASRGSDQASGRCGNGE
jgi:YD repeat-containing protein